MNYYDEPSVEGSGATVGRKVGIVLSTAVGGSVARAVWAAAEPFTLWGLARPETVAALTAAGVADVDARSAYRVARAAPLGNAAPAVVVSAFRSLPPAPIMSGLPAVWAVISPVRAQSITHDAVSAAAHEAFADPEMVLAAGQVARLLEPMVMGLDTSGRPLAAAGQHVVLPEQPWARVWRLFTTLREHRGDAHVAALVVAGLDLVETEVLMVAWAGEYVDSDMLRRSRQICDEQWEAGRGRLTTRGLLTGAGALTRDGQLLRDGIEVQTDLASAAPWLDLGREQVHAVYDFSLRVSSELVKSGQMRAVTPVGAPWPPPSLPF